MPEKIDRVNIEGVTYDIEPVMDRSVEQGGARAVTSQAAYAFIKDRHDTLDARKQDKVLDPPPEVCGEEESLIEQAVVSMADCSDVPAEGSGKFFTAGGAQADKAADFTDTSRKNFLSGMAFRAFGKTHYPKSFLGKVFGPYMGRNWKGLRISSLDNSMYAYPTGFAYNPNSNVYVMSVGGAADFAVLWSRNGFTWYTGNGIPSGINLSSVKYSDGIFVALGSNSGAYWSSDGSSWTAVTGLTAASILQYADGVWLAGGTSGLFYSANGKTWQKIHVGLTVFTAYVRSICYGNGLWVCSVYDLADTAGNPARGSVWWSTNGRNWTQTTSTGLGTCTLRRITYGSGRWIAAAYGADNTYNGIWQSTDGKNWTVINNSILQNNSPLSITYGEGNWVITLAGKMCYSPDGINWAISFDSINVVSICFANGTWVIFATPYQDELVEIYYSNDGKTWNKLLLSGQIHYLHYPEVFVGYAGGIWFLFPGRYGGTLYGATLFYSSPDEIDLTD